MKVLKFGGTSVGSVPSMLNVADIVQKTKGRRLIVLSALSGSTNGLVAINDLCKNFQKDDALIKVMELQERHLSFISEILDQENLIKDASDYVKEVFSNIRTFISKGYNQQLYKLLVIQGELLSTRIFQNLMVQKGLESSLIMAQDFMTLDENGEPNIPLTTQKYNNVVENSPAEILITQGFIARNHSGGLDNLARGGSDYTATIMGVVTQSEEVQIWTDIDGMHNNDPRIINNTRPLSHLSFEEASELAYFGAKVLHPQCIVPVHLHNIPTRIKNTMKPEADGTLISQESSNSIVKAIAAKNGITAIKIKSSRMVMAYGFLRRVFEIFEKYKTSIDMITTSEIAVSLTIDDDTFLEPILHELAKYGKVEVDKGQTIICIVGDLIAERKGVGKAIFDSLDEVPMRMISYGGSKNNISILIHEDLKNKALIQLHKALF
ncbi:MAG: aspartate kinase [Cyclobacteriaceae bacterium]